MERGNELKWYLSVRLNKCQEKHNTTEYYILLQRKLSQEQEQEQTNMQGYLQ